MNKRLKKLKLATFALAIGLFTASLFRPAVSYEVKDHTRNLTGAMCLAFGWADESVYWFANPIFAFCCFLLLYQRRINGWLPGLAFLGCLVALSSLGKTSIRLETFGPRNRVVGMSDGYYLWLASFCVLLACGLALFFLERSRSLEDQDSNESPPAEAA